MINSANRSPKSLLVEFLENNRSDETFARIVEATAGLVHSSALRRTGNAALAEEVAQNVFIILARKAESLRTHPSLTAWLYRTTSYEAEKILRRETRHHRRVEKFIAESMQDHPNRGLSQETLYLLDQAVDKLSTKDRSLLLARFFEQKKFREIASTTGQSEAACKVRLRRVMNKMATWLNARGCTLGVTALASILASEWSRASPPSLLAKTTGFLQTASASKPLIISQTLAAMKISKMTFAGIVLLIGAATTTFILRKENDATPQNSSQASIDSTHSSNTGRSTRPRKRTRSTESLLSNYPFAHKRLEKIYQKYPNLRLAKFIPTNEPTVIETLNQYYKDLEQNKRRLPEWLRAQLRGKDEWDQKRIGKFLEENDDLITRLLEISKLSTQQAKFRYLFHEQSPEIYNTLDAIRFLKTAFLYQTREGKTEKAEEIYTAINNISEGTSKPFLIHSASRLNTERNLLVSMRDLAQDGYDLTPYAYNISLSISSKSFIDALRMEASSFISFFEATKQVEDRMDLGQYLSNLMGIDSSAPPLSREDGLLMKEAGMTWDIDDFQDTYAKAISDYISEMEQWDWTVNQQQPTMRINLSQTDLPRGQALILDRLLPRTEMMTSPIFKKEILKRELITWNALNQAVAEGKKPQNISDLVPDFLTEIPVNPISNEPFVLDIENKTLNRSE